MSEWVWSDSHVTCECYCGVMSE